MRTKELFYWMQEREKIRRARQAGKKKPWTKDPILQQYRFCNVYREFDAVTMWIAEKWRTPHAADPQLWFAMVVARLFNLPNTLEKIGYPVPYNVSWIFNAADLQAARGHAMFNGAYIVSTNGHSMNKVEYLTQHVLRPLWEQCKNVTALVQRATLLQEVHDGLTAFNGLGSFMAAQVIADIKYVRPLSQCADWDTFAASGPGSRRGLNRVFDRDMNAPWGGEAAWHEALMDLKGDIDPLVKRAKMLPVHAQDLQNALCEFDKYERVRLGEGKPKQKYDGGAA